MTESQGKLYQDIELLTAKVHEWSLQETGNGHALDNGCYIFHYAPKDERIARKAASDLEKSVPSLTVVDLYEAMIDVIKGEGLLEKCFSFETKRGFAYLKTQLESVLGVTNASTSIFLQSLVNKAPASGILLLTGAGKVYPFIRSHWILQNLAERLTSAHIRTQVILFFPGDYSGLELKLFAPDMPIESNHYRAIALN